MATDVTFGINARDNSSSIITRITGKLNDLAESANGIKSIGDVLGLEAVFSLGDRVVGSLVKIGRAIYDISEQAARTQQMRNVFGNMASQAGVAADEMLGTLKTISKGLVSEVDLMASASRAALFKIPMSAMDELMRIAVASSRATGRAVSELFDDIVTGIARGSPLILDNLGIVVNITEANKKFAESIGTTAEQMSEAQKQQALLNAVLESGDDIIRRVGASMDEMSPAEKFQRVKVQWTEFKEMLGTLVLPAVSAVLTEVNKLFDTIQFRVEGLKKARQYEEDVKAAGDLMKDWVVGRTKGVLAAQLELGQYVRNQWADQMAALEGKPAKKGELFQMSLDVLALDAFLLQVEQDLGAIIDGELQAAEAATKLAAEQSKVAAATEKAAEQARLLASTERYKPNVPLEAPWMSPNYMAVMPYFSEPIEEAVRYLSDGAEVLADTFEWSARRIEEAMLFVKAPEEMPTEMFPNMPTPEGYTGGGAAAGAGGDMWAGVGQVLLEFAQKITSISLLMSPLTTLLTATMEILGPIIDDVLAPIIGELVILGQAIGKILAPVILALSPIIEAVGKAFVWLYNNVIAPVGNVISVVLQAIVMVAKAFVNMFLSILKLFIPGIQLLEMGKLDTQTLKPISFTELEEAGANTIEVAGGGVGGYGASYSSGRIIKVESGGSLITVNTDVISGDGGFEQLAIMVRNEIERVDALGL